MRNIPDDNLAYPALIVLGGGRWTGSGFLLYSGTHIFFVTAKHVLWDEQGRLKSDQAEIICQSKDPDDEHTIIFEADLNMLAVSKSLFHHPEKDVAAFTLGATTLNPDGQTYQTHKIPGVTIKQTGTSGVVTVVRESVLMLKDVLVSNDIFLYGYPGSIGLKQSPQFDYNKPLLRKGIVASVNKKQGTIILDCAVYYGNSGGPVVQVTQIGDKRRHNVIGVVTQFIPYVENWVNQSNNVVQTETFNSGYSVAVGMDFVFEMLGM